MTIVNFKSLKNSFIYAWRGLRHAYLHEQNFRIQIFLACVVIVLGFCFRISTRDVLFLTFIIGSVLVLELINTVMERFLNIVEPKIHTYAQVMKDIMAGAVLLVSLLAIIGGIIIFWPYFLEVLSQ